MPGATPPFRADHVGSLLRPPALALARAKAARGEIERSELRAVEDEAIRACVALQEDVGLRSVTDGEFRRTWFHVDFLEQIKGIEARYTGVAVKFRKSSGEELETAPPKLLVTGKLEHTHAIQGADFDFLKSVTKRTPKVTIPSPSMAHFRAGRAGVDEAAYPTMEGFFEDLARVYREEIADLAARGCRYIQFDDTNLAYLCDEKFREGARAMGENPDMLPHTYAKLINSCMAGAPDDMTFAVHLCRGNFRSAFVAEGGYDPVAEALFGELDVDAFFLEYDDTRSGGFDPLRFVPKDKFVVLGVVSSKVAALEPKDDIKRRIDSAAKILPLEQLCLSPQCGFSSTEHGNDLTEADQRAKLRLCVEVAEEVWGAL
ncbi:MAG TPA: 5-methyltetrahydropteroyltriglutamate--homocysteine S-methyltransferase [Caulobacterales bacterium]|nr:5-methyltetrahydropteroyltriglutamate--homocysteine S-methyltransferase [Caulobacterales bacterium]